jgi:hypothetical protein
MGKHVNTILLIGLLLMMSSMHSFSQSVQWARTYGGPGQDGAYSVSKTRDNGLIVTGFIAGSIFLLKTDAAGNELWRRTFSIAGSGRCVRQTNDGGYIIAGMTGISEFDAILIRTDSAGNVLWHHQYDMGDDTRGHSVWQTSDGGFILAGQAWVGSPTLGSYDMYVVKTDASGNVQWQRTYFYNNSVAPGADIALAVQQLSDRGYIIGGLTNSSVWASYLVRTDSLGNVIWSRVYATGSVNECYDLQQTYDGGFILTGGIFSFTTDVDLLLIKTDSSGNLIWQRTITPGGLQPDRGNSVRQLSDGGFIVAGQTTVGAGGYDVYVVRTDSAGDVLWWNSYGGGNDDRGFSVDVTRDGGIVVAGWTWSFGQGSGDVYMLKLLDETFEVSENVVHPTGFYLAQNYPNPFNSSTRISFTIPFAGIVTLKVYNLLGQEIATLIKEFKQTGQYEVNWDASALTSGVYFYSLEVGRFRKTKRMQKLQ